MLNENTPIAEEKNTPVSSTPPATNLTPSLDDQPVKGPSQVTPVVAPPSNEVLPTTPVLETAVTPPVVDSAKAPEETLSNPIADALEAPEEYDLEVDQDSPIDDAELAEIAAEAARLGLKKDDAQKLISAREAAYKKGQDRYKTDEDKRRENELAQARAAFTKDPDFNGELAQSSWASVSRAVQAFGTPELARALKIEEHGTNIHLAKFLKTIGDKLGPSNDSSPFPGKGSNNPSADNSERAVLRKQYPAFFENEK